MDRFELADSDQPSVWSKALARPFVRIGALSRLRPRGLVRRVGQLFQAWGQGGNPKSPLLDPLAIRALPQR